MSKIDGGDLVPDLDAHPGFGVEEEHAYWLGLTDDCLLPQITCAGFSFEKDQERIVPDPTRPGEKTRVPAVGGLDRRVTADKIAALREHLPRLVVRFIEGAQPRREEPGTGENVGDVVLQARKAELVKIPTEKQIAEARKAGRRLRRRYVRQSGDRPAADFMFMQLCEDQENPRRGSVRPPPLSETGIEWPSEIEPVKEPTDERDADRGGTTDAVA